MTRGHCVSLVQKRLGELCIMLRRCCYSKFFRVFTGLQLVRKSCAMHVQLSYSNLRHKCDIFSTKSLQYSQALFWTLHTFWFLRACTSGPSSLSIESNFQTQNFCSAGTSFCQESIRCTRTRGKRMTSMLRPEASLIRKFKKFTHPGVIFLSEKRMCHRFVTILSPRLRVFVPSGYDST